MTIRFFQPWNGCNEFDSYTFSDAEENRLVGLGLAVFSGKLGNLDSDQLYPSFYKERPFQHLVLPCGTAAINEKTVAGATTTLTTDGAAFNGRPASRMNISAGGSSVNCDIGITTLAVTLDAEAQNIESRQIFTAVKTTTGNTISNAVLFVSTDTGFTNYYTYTLQNLGTTPDGWTILGKISKGHDSVTGTPNLTGAQRIRLRIVSNANWAAGDVTVAPIYVMSEPAPSIVLSFDDGYAEHVWLADECAKRGLPVSFSIARDFIDSDSAFMSKLDLMSVINHPSGLCEAINHSIDNNSFSTIGLTRYVANVLANDAYLKSLGASDAACKCHAYVGGFRDSTLMAALKSVGFSVARAVGPENKKTNNTLISLQGRASDNLYDLQLTALLSSSRDLATVKSYVTNTATGTGLAIIAGHQLLAAAAASAWIKGYDASYGILDLLDWLQYMRDTAGWKIIKMSEISDYLTANSKYAFSL